MKSFFGFIVSLTMVVLLAGAAIALDFFKSNNLVLPRTVIGDVDISGMTRDEVRQAIAQRLKTFNEEKFKVAARGEVKTLTMKDFGVEINETLALNEIPFAGELSNLEVALWSFAGRRIMPGVSIGKPELLRVIDEQFPKLPKVKNAYLGLKQRQFKVVEAQLGVSPNLDALALQIKQHVSFLENAPLFIEFTNAKPTIYAAELNANKEAILKKIPKTLQFVYGKQKWPVDFYKNPEWIAFEKKDGLLSPEEFPFVMKFDPLSFAQFLNEGMAVSLEQLPENVKIWRDPDGKIRFEGHALDGQVIKQEELLNLANIAIATGGTEVAIPLAVVPPEVEISKDLQEIGIQEIISVGHSRFKGSPVNRIHNIGVGMSKFNGVLIAPGEVFSFDDHLGRVDESTGYRKELVIKPEGTIPDFGGGLCQVSSTMYRAALNAGMPITDRTPHTYAVTYYSQVGGHGLDATIYPPSRDLKFKNDTPGNVLIQSYVDGYDAFFKFYGVSDGRTIAMEGPYISNQRAAPKDVITVHDPGLKPGETKQVEKPHSGFDVLWYRTITNKGESKKEEIFTRYQAIPAKFLSGDEVTPEGEGQGLAGEAPKL